MKTFEGSVNPARDRLPDKWKYTKHPSLDNDDVTASPIVVKRKSRQMVLDELKVIQDKRSEEASTSGRIPVDPRVQFQDHMVEGSVTTINDRSNLDHIKFNGPRVRPIVQERFDQHLIDSGITRNQMDPVPLVNMVMDYAQPEYSISLHTRADHRLVQIVSMLEDRLLIDDFNYTHTMPNHGVVVILWRSSPGGYETRRSPLMAMYAGGDRDRQINDRLLITQIAFDSAVPAPLLYPFLPSMFARLESYAESQPIPYGSMELRSLQVFHENRLLMPSWLVLDCDFKGTRDPWWRRKDLKRKMNARNRFVLPPGERVQVYDIEQMNNNGQLNDLVAMLQPGFEVRHVQQVQNQTYSHVIALHDTNNDIVLALLVRWAPDRVIKRYIRPGVPNPRVSYNEGMLVSNLIQHPQTVDWEEFRNSRGSVLVQHWIMLDGVDEFVSNDGMFQKSLLAHGFVRIGAPYIFTLTEQHDNRPDPDYDEEEEERKTNKRIKSTRGRTEWIDAEEVTDADIIRTSGRIPVDPRVGFDDTVLNESFVMKPVQTIW